MPEMSNHPTLFDAAPRRLPEGFRYQPDLITPDERAEILRNVKVVPFRNFEFHGYVEKRRVISFGWHYDVNDRELQKAEDIPDFLAPLRDRAAAFAGIAPADLQHALVTEYEPGAARTQWEHSIPAVDELRYSITFRSMRPSR